MLTFAPLEFRAAFLFVQTHLLREPIAEKPAAALLRERPQVSEQIHALSGNSPRAFGAKVFSMAPECDWPRAWSSRTC